MSRHILIVDDNLLNLELAHDVLELSDVDVELAGSGIEGVSKAREMQPDLVLMDLRMPGMSGLEAMRLLHDDVATRHIPVVVLTASAMKGERERLMREGFDGYIQKPIDPSSFADEVCSLLQILKRA